MPGSGLSISLPSGNVPIGRPVLPHSPIVLPLERIARDLFQSLRADGEKRAAFFDLISLVWGPALLNRLFPLQEGRRERVLVADSIAEFVEKEAAWNHILSRRCHQKLTEYMRLLDFCDKRDSSLLLFLIFSLEEFWTIPSEGVSLASRLFCDAAGEGHLTLMKAMMGHPRFAALPKGGPRGVFRALYYALRKDRAAVVTFLLRTEIFEDLPQEGDFGFDYSVCYAALRGYEKSLRVLLSHPRFSAMPEEGFLSRTRAIQLLEDKGFAELGVLLREAR